MSYWGPNGSDRPPTSTPAEEHTSATDEKGAPANSAGIPKAPGTTVQRWADSAMFPAMPLSAAAGPQVSLTQAPSDPLGVVAQLAKAYKGEFVSSLSEITDDERRAYLADMQLTKLAMPLEGVHFVFSISGVTRGFTHQMVRQRTAAYSQESTRFAVIEDSFVDRVALPPSLAGVRPVENWELCTEEADPVGFGRLSDDQKNWVDWMQAVTMVDKKYGKMVNRGMPAEDARGLLPTNITTRINYVTSLRGLLDHAGNRLCTQAQFEWRMVFAQIAQALREYGATNPHASYWEGETIKNSLWQFAAIAELLKPVCYQMGKCPMQASFDRACSIRSRVDAFALHGVPSSEWGNTVIAPVAVNTEGPLGGEVELPPIYVEEWLADPAAAR